MKRGDVTGERSGAAGIRASGALGSCAPLACASSAWRPVVVDMNRGMTVPQALQGADSETTTAHGEYVALVCAGGS
jgi:hypothetical protein